MSPLRNLVQGMAAHARALRVVALSNPGLQEIYDRLCDVLDDLNFELEEEYEGSVEPDWDRFSALDSESTHVSGRA